jgi:hypothetical protein
MKGLRTTFLAALAAALGLGCSGTPSKVLRGPDGGALPCMAPLEEVGADCPAAFDGTLSSAACPQYAEQHLYRCGDTFVLLQSGAYTGLWCVYDAASLALVGATQTTDTPAYCNNRSLSEVAGRAVDQSCVFVKPEAERGCDAGIEAMPSDAGAMSEDSGDADATAADANVDAARDGGVSDAVSE